MVEDIVPSLLKKTRNDFEKSKESNEALKALAKKLQDKKATYIDANRFSIEVGQEISKALGKHISVDSLPEGKMHYNIAERILNETLSRNHELVSEYTEEVQKQLNEKAQLGLSVKVSELNQDRIDGLIDKLSDAESFEEVEWLLEEPIVNFSQSIVDEILKLNVEFHHKAGLHPEVIRTATSFCCDWCQKKQGRYKYPNVPDDIYKRHNRCKCTVEYDPKSGRKQNVWNKTWR